MSERLVSDNQPIRHSTESQSLASLIALGALLLIIELCTFEAHHQNRFYWVLFFLMLSGIPFVLAVWWTFRRKKFPGNTGIAFFLCFVPNSAALALTLITWPLYRSLFDQTADDLFRFQSRVFLPFFALLVLIWLMRKRSSGTPTNR
jgi:Fe2+ transport system protein B